MKKIGIMTFHFCDNYGAVLQSFALREVINRFEGCIAEVINFNPNWKPKWFADKNIQNKYIKKLELYESFRKEYLGIYKPMIYDLSDDADLEYDYYIVGSDQVWNLSFSFFNTAYFLDFVKENSVKISYAASVGLGINDKRLDSRVFKKYIPGFDHLSVREKTHEKFIGKFTRKEVKTVVDPTLLLKREDYDLLLNINKKKDEKFIFLYFLKHDSTAPLILSFANMLSRKYNLKIIHFFVDMPDRTFKNDSKSFHFDGPKDFLWYIKNAEIILTNSFHGTIFSIIYGKPFYTYIVKSMASRVEDLLESLGLEKRIIRGYKKLEDVNMYIDYKKTYEKLEIKREESLTFLKIALDSDLNKNI